MKDFKGEHLVLKKKFKYRFDKFGGLIWSQYGNVLKLSHGKTTLIHILSESTLTDDLLNLFPKENLEKNLKALYSEGLLSLSSNSKGTNHVHQRFIEALIEVEKVKNQKVNKPFWVHIQPSIFCNQKCIHCYCDGNNRAPISPLSVEEWKHVIDRLVEYGIIEIYITGGENLVLNDFFTLTKYIIEKGCITGLSTNAYHVTNESLKKIKELNLKIVQVSLDGSNPSINDKIRGVQGAFLKTIAGIKKLQTTSKIILNTVVNSINHNDLEDIIKVGITLGVKEFKFYPQKKNGRSQLSHIISIEDWIKIPFNLWISKYKVTIDYLKINDSCGSGFSGFSINENGMAVPCIFGTHNSSTFLGNVLTDEIDYLWFDSPVMKDFRNRSSNQPCTRCEC